MNDGGKIEKRRDKTRMNNGGEMVLEVEWKV